MGERRGTVHGVHAQRALKSYPRAEEAQKTLDLLAKQVRERERRKGKEGSGQSVNTDHSFFLLSRGPAQVQPICVKYKWTVVSLVEFYPKSAGLLGLNVNRGKAIKVRLREAQDKSQFLLYESIVHTMLHELCHCRIGEHSAEFYRLLDELIEEYEKNAANSTFRDSLCLFLSPFHLNLSMCFADGICRFQRAVRWSRAQAGRRVC